jgi:exopolyphosphatase/guanosine-5'-triphosphate,3'-diphosphate pyrophosphatase
MASERSSDPPADSAFPEAVAAIDLGSNSFHMIVARTANGEPLVLDRLREMVQIASGLDDQRRLTPEAQERALECLERFGQRVRHMAPGSVRAVGTNTLRSAHNARAFLTRAEDALGHPIETISGIEEARLIYLGVTQTLANASARQLVVDIGGGSTEIIIGESLRPLALESLYMGCISLTKRYFRKGTVDAKGWNKARIAALQELEAVRSRFRKIGWTGAVGASGTVRAVAAVLREAGHGERGITLEGLEWLRDELLDAGKAADFDAAGLSPERRPIFPAGVVILEALFEALEIETMQTADGALREGLLYDLIGRLRDEDVRLRSVKSLGDRYHVDWEQAERVRGTALALLDQVQQNWKLTSERVRQLLTWASQLHEIGLDIAHAHHHKHGEYIISQSDLLGFSREEQSHLAMLVRAHRRKFPLASFRGLPRWERRMQRAAVLLRLAVLLNRSRSPESPVVPEVEVDKKSVVLRFPDDWLDQHPLTCADLDVERSYLTALGLKLSFK